RRRELNLSAAFLMRRMKLRIGAIAQLGERVNGIHEVGGSTPPGSTNLRGLGQKVGNTTYSRPRGGFLLRKPLLPRHATPLHDARASGGQYERQNRARGTLRHRRHVDGFEGVFSRCYLG